ncbi:MAG: hypothetical protein ACE5OZ_17125 [Candidatus Heimdallarchaeota archaeon]
MIQRPPNQTICHLAAFLLSTAISEGADFEAIVWQQHETFQEQFTRFWMAAWEYGLLSETLDPRISTPVLECSINYLLQTIEGGPDVEPSDLFTFLGFGENVFNGVVDVSSVSFSEYLMGDRAIVVEDGVVA